MHIDRRKKYAYQFATFGFVYSRNSAASSGNYYTVADWNCTLRIAEKVSHKSCEQSEQSRDEPKLEKSKNESDNNWNNDKGKTFFNHK
ncbi:MAG: hypothetical protein ACR2M8_03620 [Pyrinomonadaceae bacterium]